jgi:hypothetical protein
VSIFFNPFNPSANNLNCFNLHNLLFKSISKAQFAFDSGFVSVNCSYRKFKEF